MRFGRSPPWASCDSALWALAAEPLDSLQAKTSKPQAFASVTDQGSLTVPACICVGAFGRLSSIAQPSSCVNGSTNVPFEKRVASCARMAGQGVEKKRSEPALGLSAGQLFGSVMPAGISNG